MFREACDIECAFVKDAVPVSTLGMNADNMVQYIKYVVDYWLKCLCIPPLYGVTNPFEFMELLSLEGKTNFFEQRVTEYTKADLQRPGEMDFGSGNFDF